MKKILLMLCILLPMLVQAQMTTRVIKENLFIPWEIIYGTDNHLWLTQKNGYICRLDPVNGQLDTIYHETNTVVQNEGGMLGMALHPDFVNSPYVYVAYNYMNGGDYRERIVRYTYANNALSSPLTLLDNIDASNIHNGCRLLIVGDKLFITTGDASTASVAQDIANINGKILRINLDGSLPADNPDPASPVWSMGHRNAQGMVYANSKLYSSEHGATSDDEINIITSGRNYGWPDVQGYCDQPSEATFCTNNNVVEPIEAWTPTLAVSDIDYYDHPMFPAMQKSLIMATLKDQQIYQLTLNGSFDDITAKTVIQNNGFGRIRALCISPAGSIFFSTSNSNANGSGALSDKIVEIYDPNFVPVGVTAVNGTDINIYPNPAGQYIEIQMGNTAKITYYRLMNMMGQVQQEGRQAANNSRIALNNLPAGTYMLHLTDTKGQLYHKRIIKQ